MSLQIHLPILLPQLSNKPSRFYSILKQPWNTIFSLVLTKAIQIPATIGLILCIVGATSAKTPASIDSETTVHIGIILFAVVYCALLILTFAAFLGHKRTQRGEGALILAVALALPFEAVRILYALLAVFSHDRKFSALNGSTTINLFMAVLPECVVVAIYLLAGLKLDAIPRDQRSETAAGDLRYRLGRGDFGMGKLGILSLGSAAIQAMNGRGEQRREQAAASAETRPQRYEKSHRSHGRRHGDDRV